jgi:hypothetical protein
MRTLFMMTLGVAAVAGCSSATAPPARDHSGQFCIVVDRSAYMSEEASQTGIAATVTNTSNGSDFYARAGDAMGLTVGPVPLYAAIGTQAIIERRISTLRWENANVGQLFEGSRYVLLSAGMSHRLYGRIAPNSPGTYRVRLDYSETPDEPPYATVYSDYSEAFIVR